MVDGGGYNGFTITGIGLIKAGSPKAFGFIMLRIAPIGRSSPMFHLTPPASLPRPSVKSIVSPKMSEKDSFIAPDWL